MARKLFPPYKSGKGEKYVTEDIHLSSFAEDYHSRSIGLAAELRRPCRYHRQTPYIRQMGVCSTIKTEIPM